MINDKAASSVLTKAMESSLTRLRMIVFEHSHPFRFLNGRCGWQRYNDDDRLTELYMHVKHAHIRKAFLFAVHRVQQ